MKLQQQELHRWALALVPLMVITGEICQAALANVAPHRARRSLSDLMNLLPQRPKRDTDKPAGDGAEQFEAMCLMSREPSLQSPPELMYFSAQNHSRHSFGCSSGSLKFRLESRELHEDDNECPQQSSGQLRHQLVESQLYNASLETYFLVHGFMASWDSDAWMCQLKDLILNKSEANVFILDWSGGSKPMLPIDYGAAVANTKRVAELLATFINALLRASSTPDPGRFHLIGHSLGAQISGFTGYLLEGSLGRITALDPAGPCFSSSSSSSGVPSVEASAEGILQEGTDERRRLSASSAKLVLAIHTDCPLFGLRENCAHYDVYYNGGAWQPGCEVGLQPAHLVQGDLAHSLQLNIACKHTYSHDLVEAFDEPDDDGSCQPMAYECSSWEAFLVGECGLCLDNDARCVFLGLHKQADRAAPPTSLSQSECAGAGSGPRPQLEDCGCNEEDEGDSTFGSASYGTNKPTSDSSTYLINTAKHFIKSGLDKPHCLHHYQILIAVKRVEEKSRRKYHLRIPLAERDNSRLVRVSHLMEQQSEAYKQNEQLMMKQYDNEFVQDQPVDFYSALITFQHNCQSNHVRSICRPLDMRVKGFELWSEEEASLTSVQWVAMNYMSNSKLSLRKQHSSMFQPDPESPECQAGPDPSSGHSGKSQPEQLITEGINKLGSTMSSLGNSIGLGSGDEKLSHYIKLAPISNF